MTIFELKISSACLDVLLVALIDRDQALSQAIKDERVCTNNSDTIELLRSDRTRIEGIIHQLSTQTGTNQ
jgi:hypothetical protein